MNTIRNLATGVLHAIWSYKVPLAVVFLAVASFFTGHTTALETALLVALVLGVLIHEIWIK